MLDLAQELMTPDEAARWFRRSPSWLRQQRELLHTGGPGGQPLYHVCVCRAYILGRLRGLSGVALRRVQIQALAAACGLRDEGQPADNGARASSAASQAATATEAGECETAAAELAGEWGPTDA